MTYSLVGDTSGGAFTINATTGKVTVADPSKVHLADPSYDITVDASDGTLHSQQTFTIAVVLDAAPVVTAGHTLDYTENQAATAIDPALTVTDVRQRQSRLGDGADHRQLRQRRGRARLHQPERHHRLVQCGDRHADPDRHRPASRTTRPRWHSVTYLNTSDNPSGAGPHRHHHHQ